MKEKVNDFDFTTHNAHSVTMVSVPTTLLEEIGEKGRRGAREIADFLLVNDVSVKKPSKLMSAMSKLSYIAGAASYYTINKKGTKNEQPKSD